MQCINTTCVPIHLHMCICMMSLYVEDDCNMCSVEVHSVTGFFVVVDFNICTRYEYSAGSVRISLTSVVLYKRTYIHTYIQYIHTHIHICIHTYTHTYMHTYIHTHTYMHTYIHTHVHTHTYMYVSGDDCCGERVEETWDQWGWTAHLAGICGWRYPWLPETEHSLPSSQGNAWVD